MTAAPSVHTRYGTRLAALADDEGLLGPGFERVYARFHPHRDPFATLVLQGDGERRRIVRVDVFEERPAGERVERGEAGWVRTAAFTSDPALRPLSALLARCPQHSVMRYRPYRRCTVRVDRDRHSVYAKVFADRRGERIHRDGAALWEAAERGELAFAVPRPERLDRRERTLWQSPVAGRPVRGELSGPRGETLARRMGAALASLAGAGVSPRQILGPEAVMTRSARLAGALVRSVPALERPVGELLRRLQRGHAAAAPRPLAPVHGDPYPGQWLHGGDGVGLVDFDGLALGHRELDAAAFLAALAFEDRSRVPVETLSEAFLDAYRATGRPLDVSLLALYGAHRRLAKALRVASSLRPDGDRRAERHVERALRELGEEPR